MTLKSFLIKHHLLKPRESTLDVELFLDHLYGPSWKEDLEETNRQMRQWMYSENPFEKLIIKSDKK